MRDYKSAIGDLKALGTSFNGAKHVKSTTGTRRFRNLTPHSGEISTLGRTRGTRDFRNFIPYQGMKHFKSVVVVPTDSKV